MRSDLALTPSEGVGIGERYFPEKPKIVPGVIRQGKNPIPLFRTLKPYGMFGGFAWGDLQIQPRRFFRSSGVYCSQLKHDFCLRRFSRARSPLTGCWFGGCFFECMEFISPCTGKNKTFSLTLEFVLLWGLKIDLRIELTPRDFWNPQSSGARYRFPDLRVLGSPRYQ